MSLIYRSIEFKCHLQSRTPHSMDGERKRMLARIRITLLTFVRPQMNRVMIETKSNTAWLLFSWMGGKLASEHRANRPRPLSTYKHGTWLRLMALQLLQPFKCVKLIFLSATSAHLISVPFPRTMELCTH